MSRDHGQGQRWARKDPEGVLVLDVGQRDRTKPVSRRALP